ncbi:MAG: DALR anticodon-binding domain-containing protein, partial [Bacilli bacterium]|nr:DALR anticodon-binding domain-containing protein [Bacilli bacterium]
DVINEAASTREPYKIANYIQQLAQNFHSFYNECRVIDADNLELSGARLSLVKATKIVLKNALDLIGVSAPESM